MATEAQELDKMNLPATTAQEPKKITNAPVNLTQAHIQQIFGSRGDAEWYKNFKQYCDEKSINTVFRLSAFFAQISVETGKLSRLEENLNYSAVRLVQVFPKYFQSKERALEYAGNPQKIANRVYGGRMGNGDEASGDGYRYRGRGCIQLTGKYNYEAATRGGVSCLGENANYLLSKEGAVRSAVWFWNSKGLNSHCDRGDFATVSRIINGGTNGWAERNSEYARIIKILADMSADATVETDPGVTETTANAQVDPQPPIDDNTPAPPPNAPTNTIKENIPPGNSVYPWNKSFESRSGHVIEIDDTPDRERLQWYHRSGTYTEFQPNGDSIDKTVLTRFVFSNETRESVSTNKTSMVGGDWYTRTNGQQTHITPVFNVNASAAANFTTPIAKFSNIIDGDILVVNFIKVRRNGRYGNVQDLKARQAEYADRAGRLGGSSVIPGSYSGPDWVNMGRGVHTVAGFPAHEPVDLTPKQWGVALAKRAAVFYCFEGLEYQTAGDSIARVDNDVVETNGGNRKEITEGGRVIASGNKLTLASNTAVEVISPVGLVAGLVVHKRRQELPDHLLFDVGDIVTINLNGCLVNKLRGADGWEEIDG